MTTLSSLVLWVLLLSGLGWTVANRGGYGRQQGGGAWQQHRRGGGAGQQYRRGGGVGQQHKRGSGAGQQYRRGGGMGQQHRRGGGAGQQVGPPRTGAESRGVGVTEEDLKAMKQLQQKRWPNNVVPIKFDPNFPQSKQHHVYQVMESLNALSCLTLVNATQHDTRHHILISNFRPGCFANVGYTKTGKNYQDVNLAQGCFYGRNKVSHHEILHALGFHHMQVRFERDEYLQVYKDKVKPSSWHNFDKEKGAKGRLSGMGLPYDYNSVMHYPVFAFGINNQQTMKLKREFEGGEVGVSLVPSRTDVAALNRMYECWDHYLGDDIPGAIPYKKFHTKYFPSDSSR